MPRTRVSSLSNHPSHQARPQRNMKPPLPPWQSAPLRWSSPSPLLFMEILLRDNESIILTLDIWQRRHRANGTPRTAPALVRQDSRHPVRKFLPILSFPILRLCQSHKPVHALAKFRFLLEQLPDVRLMSHDVIGGP